MICPFCNSAVNNRLEWIDYYYCSCSYCMISNWLEEFHISDNIAIMKNIFGKKFTLSFFENSSFEKSHEIILDYENISLKEYLDKHRVTISSYIDGMDSLKVFY